MTIHVHSPAQARPGTAQAAPSRAAGRHSPSGRGMPMRLLLAAGCLAALSTGSMALGSSGGVAGSGIGLTDPSLSFGLTGISDYGVEMPFLDLMKAARPFYGDRASGGTAKLSDLGASVLDADGWPREIPAGMKSVSTVWDWSGTGSDAAVKAQRVGTYVLEYEGSGKITVAGSVKVLSSEPGRIVFDNTGGGTMRVSITQTDPGHTGDYIRDISVVAQKYEALHAAGEIFNPGFLAVVQDARELRFMDWMKTNGSEQRDFGARPEVSDATWSGPGGVPLEVMVQLANQTGTDPWFCMPAKATDAYVASFAAYVRDHLDPALKAHVEFSNETWNWSFSQTGWLDGQAKALWGSKAAVYDYVAMRATQVALIWDETFGSQADARVENVLAVQTANPGVASRELAGKLWAQHDPAGFVAPGSVFDALAVTTYFGNSVMSQPDRRAELLAKIRDPHVDAVAWLAGKLMDPAYSSSIPQLEGKWAANKAIADAYGLDLVAYEGGQHAHQSFAINGISAGDLAVLTDFMTGFVRSPQMGALYGALWDAWAEVSDGAFMQFGDVGQPSKWGSWGLLSSLGDTNPRATEILASNAANDAWFGDGGGARYQQGKILQAGNGGETLVGTQKIDFLVGGKGDDTPHRGPRRRRHQRRRRLRHAGARRQPRRLRHQGRGRGIPHHRTRRVRLRRQRRSLPLRRRKDHDARAVHVTIGRVGWQGRSRCRRVQEDAGRRRQAGSAGHCAAPHLAALHPAFSRRAPNGRAAAGFAKRPQRVRRHVFLPSKPSLKVLRCKIRARDCKCPWQGRTLHETERDAGAHWTPASLPWSTAA